MVRIQQHWSWSLTLLLIIQNGRCSATLPHSRVTGAVTDPLAELKVLSCSQQIEKLKIEAQRHVSAVNSIADGPSRVVWRNRKLLTALQPPTSKFTDDSVVQMPVKTEDNTKNSLTKYLKSLDHSSWVSKCLEGGKCNMSDSGVANQTNKTKAIETKNRTNSADKQKGTNYIIDLLSQRYQPLDVLESINSRSKVEDSVVIGGENFTSPSNQSVTSHSPVLSNGRQTNVSHLVEDNSAKPREYTGDSITVRTIPVHKNVPLNPEPVQLFRTESPPEPTVRDSVLSEYPNPYQFNSSKYYTNNNQLVYYDNHFPPLTVHFTPMAYYDRYPRSGTELKNDDLMTRSSIENTFSPYGKEPYPIDRLSHLLVEKSETDEKVPELGTLDNLVADYGNDLFKRSSTGKRESEYFNGRKEAVTTYYPEEPSSLGGNPYGQTGTRVTPGGNGTNPNIYLFVGGSWVANFKDNPPLIYIQPQFTQTKESSQQLPYQPSFSSVNLESASKRILAPPPELYQPPPYSPPSYAVYERSPPPGDSRPCNNARSASGAKTPPIADTGNGYVWNVVDNNNIPNYANVNGPDRGGTVDFPNAEDPRVISDVNRKDKIRPDTDGLNYEDSLVNFPPPKYEVRPPEASTLKPEESMEHDIDKTDMFILGSQLLAALPLAPPNRRTDESDDESYGVLITNGSSQSSPAKQIGYRNPSYPFYAEPIASRTRLPYRPEISTPSAYNRPSSSNEFDFVSGQWVKRRPGSADRLMYDQVGRRLIRDIGVGFPVIYHLNQQNPSPSFKSKSSCKPKF